MAAWYESHHVDLLEKENIVTGQKVTLTYDQRGQLTRAILNGARTNSYGIDGEGHRLTRSIDGVMQTGYLHDVSGRLVAEVEPSGALRSHFVYASQSHSPDYMIRGTPLYYFAKDNLGSVKTVIDTDSGAIAQAIHYDEFGRVLVNTNPGFQPFGFAGGHFDHETGLVRFGARDYDPDVGRWVSKDPILLDGGDTNLYRYVLTAPVNLLDSDGLRASSASEFNYGSSAGSGTSASIPLGICLKPTKPDRKVCANAFHAAIAGCDRMAPGNARNQCRQNATNDYVKCLQSFK